MAADITPTAAAKRLSQAFKTWLSGAASGTFPTTVGVIGGGGAVNHVTGATGTVGRALVGRLSNRVAPYPCTILRPPAWMQKVVSSSADRWPPERAPT